MGKSNFSDEFKRDAVAHITKRVREWSQRLLPCLPRRNSHSRRTLGDSM